MPTMTNADPLWLLTLSLRPGLQDLTAWSDEDQQAVGAHFQGLQEQARAGRLVLAGRSQDQDSETRLADNTIGVAIFHAADREAALAVAEADPAVRAGVMRFELRSFAIAAARDGVS